MSTPGRYLPGLPPELLATVRAGFSFFMLSTSDEMRTVVDAASEVVANHSAVFTIRVHKRSRVLIEGEKRQTARVVVLLWLIDSNPPSASHGPEGPRLGKSWGAKGCTLL